MARRNSGHSLIGLMLEIGLIAFVVWLLPKANLRPAARPAPSSESPWWQAQPAAHETSWQMPAADEVRVEQTLQDAGRRLLSGAADYASRTAGELFAQPASPSTPPPPISAQPQGWRSY